MASIERSQLKIVIFVVAVCILLVSARPALAGDGSVPAQVEPTIESVSDTFAFVRWVTANPGGTTLHYAVDQYGTDPAHLGRVAESPTRINPSHSDMTFRVRVNDLQAGTTYYYRVFSRQANGDPDPVISAVKKFTTRPANEAAAK